MFEARIYAKIVVCILCIELALDSQIKEDVRNVVP